jgi:hypothetical protein
MYKSDLSLTLRLLVLCLPALGQEKDIKRSGNKSEDNLKLSKAKQVGPSTSTPCRLKHSLVLISKMKPSHVITSIAAGLASVKALPTNITSSPITVGNATDGMTTAAVTPWNATGGPVNPAVSMIALGDHDQSRAEIGRNLCRHNNIPFVMGWILQVPYLWWKYKFNEDAAAACRAWETRLHQESVMGLMVHECWRMDKQYPSGEEGWLHLRATTLHLQDVEYMEDAYTEAFDIFDEDRYWPKRCEEGFHYQKEDYGDNIPIDDFYES